MAKVPASIRYKNPGAMWGGAHATKWGAFPNATVKLDDGTGQGNTIAVFPTHVDGIAAQVALWRTARYRNKPFKEAIIPWSGGNHVPAYIKLVAGSVPGFTGNTVIDDEFLLGPHGIAFLKAQARHEAGKPYPAPDADWIEGRRRAFEGAAKPSKRKPAAPKPDPAAEPPHGQKDERFGVIQRRLQALGYFEVGEPDDKWGGRTAAGIAAFKNDRKLTGPALPDSDLDAELSKAEGEGWKRPISADRKEASDAKIAETTEALPAAKKSWLGNLYAAFVAAATWIVKNVAEQFENVWGNPIVMEFREFASTRLSWIIAAVVAYLAWNAWQNYKTIKATRADFHSGRLT